MKRRFYLSAMAIVLFACTSRKADPVLTVTVQNPTAFDRLYEMVEIPVDTLQAKVPLADSLTWVVKNAAGEIIPSQVTYDGKLIFQAGVKASEISLFKISSGAPQAFQTKAYGRYIRERKDDFAWENDRVAFRIYGPALIEIDGPSNGIDLWYKRTNDLVIEKWYKDDLAGVASYHNDNGQGLDDYKVGRTLGGGAMAPYVDNKLWLNQNYATQELLENGPLRTTFRLVYPENMVTVKGKRSQFTETRLFSIDAGSQLTRVTQSYGVSEAIPVAAGIVKRAAKDAVTASVGKGYIVYAEPATPKVSGIFVGLIIPGGLEGTKVDSYRVKNKQGKEDTYFHELALTTYHPGQPITYYTGYGWSSFGFPEAEDFVGYMESFADALAQPLVVTW